MAGECNRIRISQRCLAALLASVCIAGAANDKHEPTYEGHTLSEWMGDIDPHAGFTVGHEPAAWTAIAHIGTNAIPTLLKWLSEPDPPESPKPELPSCYNLSRSQRAEFAFQILGDVARPAIPELTRLARKSSDPERADRCATSLAYIGPAAIPSLLSLATNAPTQTRSFAIEALAYIPSDQLTKPAVPVLIRCMGDKNDDVANIAADIMNRTCAAEVVEPALTNALRSPSARTRKWAVRCLGWEEQNVSIIPLMRAAMRDSNYEVRESATNVLRSWGGWEIRGENWVRRWDTSAQNGITPELFNVSQAPH
jgi:HEAT repeat protein